MRLEVSGVDRRDDVGDELGHAQDAEVVPVALRIAPVGVAGDHGSQAHVADRGQQLAGAGQWTEPIVDGYRHGAADARDRRVVRLETGALEAGGDELLGAKRDPLLGRDRARLIARLAALEEIFDDRRDLPRVVTVHRGLDAAAPASRVGLPDRPRVGPQSAADVDQGYL